LGSRHSAN